MQWASCLSLKTSIEDALHDCAAGIHSELGASPDLIFLFLSPHFAKNYDEVPKMLRRWLQPAHLLGCSAGGVIASGREAEDCPATGMLAASLPKIDITPVRLQMDGLPDLDAPPRAWSEALGLPPGSHQGQSPSFVLLADPFSFNPEDLTRGLDYAYPDGVKIGGLASGAGRPEGNVLYLDSQAHRSGLVGMALSGNILIDPIVAQGCRPVGPPMKVTGCEENRLLELDHKPALEVIAEMLRGLPDEDRELARTSLFVGLLTTPLRSETSRRDYLIRNIIGLDAERDVLAIGAPLRPGQGLQFHLRDKHASREDLRSRLQLYSRARLATRPAAALLFSCLGRGARLYGMPDHDSALFIDRVGKVPLAGFFCNGEIGPVDRSTYLHGYTSCFGIVRPRKS
ncbi:MAG: FIST C-terminal domain-containing protein [Elusimicrobia bacterium]|nr:FIST C-terminal domain-containing protein [Elusimicrobiota bacterium]